MAEEVGFFALDDGQKLEAPIVITEGGIAIGGTAVPGIILDGEVYVDPVPTDPDQLRTVTVKFAAEGGVVLHRGLRLETAPDGRLQVRSPGVLAESSDGVGVGTPSPQPPGGLGA